MFDSYDDDGFETELDFQSNNFDDEFVDFDDEFEDIEEGFEAEPDQLYLSTKHLVERYLPDLQIENAEKWLFGKPYVPDVNDEADNDYLNIDVYADQDHLLGFMHLTTVHSDNADTIEQALILFQRALLNRTQLRRPYEWGETMIALASAFKRRSWGNKSENIEKAIYCLSQVLKISTPDTEKLQLAQACSNIANALSMRKVGASTANVEAAIVWYQHSLCLFSEIGHRESWLKGLYNLACTYLLDRLAGIPAENTEIAIDYFLEVSRGMSPTNGARNLFISWNHDPLAFAQVKTWLGYAYSLRVRGAHTDNVKKALDYYRQALELINGNYSYNSLFSNLGKKEDPALGIRRLILNFAADLQFREGYWQEAYNTYCNARDAEKEEMSQAYTEMGQRAISKQFRSWHVHSAFCLLKLNRLEDALMMLESGRTRVLSLKQSLKFLDLTKLDAEDKNLVQELLQDIKELTYFGSQLDNDIPLASNAASFMLMDLHTKLDQRLRDLQANGKISDPIVFKPQYFASIISSGRALVIPLFTPQGSAVIVITNNEEKAYEIHLIELPNFSTSNLEALIGRDARSQGWLYGYQKLLDNHSPDNAAIWYQFLDDFCGRLWNELLEPIHEFIKEKEVKTVIFIPQGGLQILPLHAAWRNVNGIKRYFIDDYKVSYAPSIAALWASHHEINDFTPKKALLAGVSIYEQLPPLPYVPAEIATLAHLLNVAPLLNEQVTLEQIQKQSEDADLLHFACHGKLNNVPNPLLSGLYFANNEQLTLWDVLSRLTLRSKPLVILSACESGITDLSWSPDESVGLSTGFLEAGACGVISTLWPVDDRSTSLLIERFYQNLIHHRMKPNQALRDAQIWLRQSSLEEIMNPIGSHSRSELTEFHQKLNGFLQIAGNSQPYSHPYYWAGFMYSGTV